MCKEEDAILISKSVKCNCIYIRQNWIMMGRFYPMTILVLIDY